MTIPKNTSFNRKKSLTNLKTDYLDVLLLHRPSPLMQVEEIAAAFAQLKSSGKVKSFGVSNFTPSQMTYLQQEVDLDWNQIECSLSHNTPMFDGSLDYHLSQQIKSMAWSLLGNYFKEKNAANERVHQLMQELCTTYNATEDQLLLAWLLNHPAKIYPVLGTTRIERLTSSLAAENIKLQLTDWFRLLETQWGHEVPKTHEKENNTHHRSNQWHWPSYCTLFAQRGDRLILCGRRQERLDELQRIFDCETHLLNFDVRERAAVFSAIESLTNDWKKIDLLINNAGNAHGLDPVHKANLDDWDAMIDGNVKGLMYVTKAVLPHG